MGARFHQNLKVGGLNRSLSVHFRSFLSTLAKVVSW